MIDDQVYDQLMDLSREDIVNRLIEAIEALDFYSNTKLYYKAGPEKKARETKEKCLEGIE